MALIIFRSGEVWQASARIAEYVCEECLGRLSPAAPPLLREKLFNASIYHNLRLADVGADGLDEFRRAVASLLHDEEARYRPGADPVDDLRYDRVVRKIRELHEMLAGLPGTGTP